MQTFLSTPAPYNGVHLPSAPPPDAYYMPTYPANASSVQGSLEGFVPVYYVPPPQYMPYIIPVSSAPPLYTSPNEYADHLRNIQHQSQLSPPTYHTPQQNSAKKDQIEMDTIKSGYLSRYAVPIPTSSTIKKEPTVFATSPIDSSFQKEASPSIEAFDIQQKKCKKCAKFYKEDQNALDACRFHSGHFQAFYKSTLGMGSLISWSCCKLCERDAPGCKIGRHLECVATTKALKQFTQAMENSEKQKEAEKFNLRREKRTISSQSLIDLNEDLNDLSLSGSQEAQSSTPGEIGSMYPSLNPADSRFTKVGTEDYIKHNVALTDTVSGLSIKYNVLVEEIKSANKLTKDEDLWTRFQVLIPFRGQDVPGMDDKERKKYKQDMKSRLVKRFRRAVSCGENEAKYYLKLNDWDIDVSLKEYRDDINWEKTNPPKKPLSKKIG